MGKRHCVKKQGHLCLVSIRGGTLAESVKKNNHVEEELEDEEKLDGELMKVGVGEWSRSCWL